MIVGAATLTSLVILASLKWRSETGSGIVTVVVLGDVGRSPRMQYHSLSLAQFGYEVDIVGFSGSQPLKKLTESSKVHIHNLPETPSFIDSLRPTHRYVVKTLYWMLSLMFVLLWRTKKSKACLVQTPPAVPTLLAVWLMSVLRGTKMIIDWHNYGYTIMGLSLGEGHPLVKVSQKYEGFLGSMAHSNLCVTEAMKNDLFRRWGIRAIILYDRPPEMFKPILPRKQHELFVKLGKKYPQFKGDAEEDSNMTAFTRQNSETKMVTPKPNRPFLIVSSTSWTEDEDFSILLKALEDYEKTAENDARLPRILCVITGKGPLKSFYEGEIAKKNFKKVTICTLWLEAEDYPLLLGSADLGVSLHKSSSGLDLPMKVVDMFGCGLPVCAIEFKCINELVQHQHNGLLFKTPETLASQIKSLVSGFPEASLTLKKLRENLISFQSLRWDHYWKMHVRPLLH